MLSKRKGYNAIPDLSLANGFLSLLVVQYGHLPLTKRWCEFSLQGNHDKVVRFFPCSWSREGEKGGQKCQKRLLKRKNERAPWEVTIVHEGEEDSNSSVASFDSLILALFRLLLPRGRAPFLAAKKNSASAEVVLPPTPPTPGSGSSQVFKVWPPFISESFSIPPSLQIQHIQMNPKHALLVGGALYGCGVAYMFRNYYKKSSFRQIYVKADQNYDKVKIMHPPTQASV